MSRRIDPALSRAAVGAFGVRNVRGDKVRKSGLAVQQGFSWLAKGYNDVFARCNG